MADEKVNIVVKVITKTKQLDALLARLKAVEAMESRLSSGRNVQKYAQGAGAALSRATGKWKKHFDFLDGAIRGFGKALTKFLGLAIKGVIIEMGLLAAAMVGWHALVKGGQYIVKAYHGVMQLLAGGAAAATVAIATVSAAIREQQAAMYAYRGKGARQFGSGMNQTAMAMRNLQMNADLASLGVEALNGAFASMSKTMSSVQINRSGQSIKALMDFGAAGQDPKKAAAQVGTIVAALEDEKKTLASVMSEAKKLGPEMEKALKGTKVKTKKEFKELLLSGELAKKGGVLGQFDAVNETLISQLTKYFTLLRGKFADFGEQFLGPTKKAFQSIFNTISRDLGRLMASISYSFGAENFISGFANGVEKLSGWLVKTIREYLPKLQGMFGKIGDWMSNFKRGWNLVLEKLRPLIDGARVVEKAFKEIWYAIKEGASNMGQMRDLLIANESTVIETGTRIADLIRDVSKLLSNMKNIFFEILPFLNDVLSGIGMLIRGMTKMLTGLGGGGGSFLKALAPLFAFQIFGKRMQGAAGKLMPGITGQGKSLPFSNVSSMPVTAQNVYVNGQPVPGAGTPAAAAANGRMSSGAGGGGGVAPGMYGPAYSAMQQQYRGPVLSKVYAPTAGAQLSDYGQKVGAHGYRDFTGSPQTPISQMHGYGGGIAIAQAPVGSNQPTNWMLPNGQLARNSYSPERDYYATEAKTAPYRGQAMDPNGGRTVYQDVRANQGVFINERGIAMAVSQNSQRLTDRMQFDDRMRMGESMRMGRLMKSGFERGDMYRAGMDQRAYERSLMLNTPGAGMITPSLGANMSSNYPVTTAGGNANIDYSRMGEKRLARLARARGVDTSGGAALTAAGLRQQDIDRQLAHRAVAGDRSAVLAMSPGFRNGEFNRWKTEVKDPNTGKPTGEIRYRDPGLTMRERMTRSGMRMQSRFQDVASTLGIKAAGAAGSFQGAMGYLNSGRFDATLNDGKGDFVNVSQMRKDAKQRMDDARNLQNRGKIGTRLSYAREMARIARTETKFGASQKRFAQSGTGRMGTGMALSMASQYAPEEMRGAMALGGTLSMIDPRLGLAVAGVGGALKAKSVGAGALAGAAGGAQIGAMFGPWGAAIGAGIGLLGGGIMGAINKNKALMKEARKAAQDSINSVFTGIAVAASRQFDRNREDQAKGIDISNRSRAFGSLSEKFSTKRRSAVLEAIEQVMGKSAATQFGDIASGKIQKGVADFDSSSYSKNDATMMQRGSKYGTSIAFNDSDAGNKRAREFVDYFYENQKKFGMTISEDQYKKMTKGDTATRNAAMELVSIGGSQDKAFAKMEGVNNKRIEALSKATGKSGAELEILAQQLGVNLYDATVKYSDLVKQMGGAMIKTADQLNNALIDLFMNTENKYKTNIQAREAQQTIDRASQGYRDRMLSKDATEAEKQEATDEYFSQYATNVLALNKGDAFAAYTDTRNMFKRGDAFKKGNVFEGMEGTQAQSEGLVLVDQMRKDMTTGMVGQLTNMAAAAGQEFDAKALEKYITGLSDTQFETLAGAAYSKNKATGKTRMENLFGDGGDVGMRNLMKVLNMDPTKLGYKTVNEGEAGEAGTLNEFTGDLKKYADQQKLDYTIFKGAVDQYVTTTASFFKGDSGGPDWWKTGLIWDSAKGQLRPPDTYSPRGGQIGDTTTSKLSQTMARHQAMDGQLTGKRTVTSSWRNFNLGSSNSDHVTGRAYDLVGQNLGKYATMVHANGGFAEFHGNMAERHLHVVPGPTPGVGDTPVPAMNTKAIPAGGSTSTGPGNYSITINGANQSPEAIANMVVAKLNDRERSYRER